MAIDNDQNLSLAQKLNFKLKVIQILQILLNPIQLMLENQRRFWNTFNTGCTTKLLCDN